jgi:hypothetical protein
MIWQENFLWRIKPMDEDGVLKRIIESKVFIEEEIKIIKEHIILCEKCYLLGVLDAKF